VTLIENLFEVTPENQLVRFGHRITFHRSTQKSLMYFSLYAATRYGS
jgi:hypothetical protein